jgi:hypothetical protein
MTSSDAEQNIDAIAYFRSICSPEHDGVLVS